MSASVLRESDTGISMNAKFAVSSCTCTELNSLNLINSMLKNNNASTITYKQLKKMLQLNTPIKYNLAMETLSTQQQVYSL